MKIIVRIFFILFAAICVGFGIMLLFFSGLNSTSIIENFKSSSEQDELIMFVILIGLIGFTVLSILSFAMNCVLLFRKRKNNINDISSNLLVQNSFNKINGTKFMLIINSFYSSVSFMLVFAVIIAVLYSRNHENIVLSSEDYKYLFGFFTVGVLFILVFLDSIVNFKKLKEF